MKIQGVGHVVLKVRDLERSVRFYSGVLGLKEVGRLRDQMVFFSAGVNHHDLAVLAGGPAAPAPPRTPGGGTSLADNVPSETTTSLTSPFWASSRATRNTSFLRSSISGP